MSDRDAFRENRTAGPRARHETREARAIRKQVAEEIAEAIERSEDNARHAEKNEGIAGNKAAAHTWFSIATGYMRSAELAREVGTKETGT